LTKWLIPNQSCKVGLRVPASVRGEQRRATLAVDRIALMLGKPAWAPVVHFSPVSAAVRPPSDRPSRSMVTRGPQDRP
jgi:hypothetical protein